MCQSCESVVVCNLVVQVADLVETLEEKDDLELFITDEEAVEAVWTAMSALSL